MEFSHTDEKYDMYLQKLLLFQIYHLDNNYCLYIRYRDKIDPSSLNLDDLNLVGSDVHAIYRNIVFIQPFLKISNLNEQHLIVGF